MSEKDGLREVEARCDMILHSPYLFRELPEELHRLKSLLVSVDVLAREDVPRLIAEIRKLRTENKRLEAMINASPAESDEEVAVEDEESSATV